jgi:hypothetical protein
MKIYKAIILTLTLVMLVPLTGCGPTYINVKPSAESLEELEHSASGKVHVYPTAKGPKIEPASKDPKATDLSPYKDSLTITEDDVVAAVNNSAIDAIRQAGYSVSSGNEVPGDAQIEVGITVQKVLATYTRNGLTQQDIHEALVGDAGKREDSIFSRTFGNLPTGVIITEVKFTNRKTKDTFTQLVSGADSSLGFGTNAMSIQSALSATFHKYDINLVKALELFQKGLLK